MSQDQGWAAPGRPEGPRGSDGGGQEPSGAPPWSAGPPADGGPAVGGSSAGAGWGPPPGAGPAWSAPQRPGIVPLRPLGVFELFEGGFRAISANPKVMLGVSAVVFGGVAVLSLLLTPLFGGAVAGFFNDTLAGAGAGQGDVAFTATSFTGADPVTTIVSFLATTALTGLLVLSVSGSVVGREIRGGELWHRVKGRLLALVGLSLLQGLLLGLVVLAPVAVGALAFLSGSDGAGAAGLVVGLLAGVVLTVWLYVRWAFAAVVLLLERRRVVDSLRRSSSLVRGTWWRVLGVLLLTTVVAGLAQAVLVGPAALISGVVGALGAGAGPSAVATLVTLLFSTVASILVVPFVSAVTALLYTDLRIRQEGLDVELARAAEASP
ncbi:glycerophosphoryl diester phosphodiesterase membrane domain-containing protein [Pseudokineococcus basanitobsidens]|uniref:Glycerophosphoryl diester phosphodiesterase membrane domain-containing protein n=1 Tax=Pseudokineococcus basanitobsidens TaxID=1926649 RepID=A0ABU8RM42_9ACTN